jgi:hypothetical protein
VPCPDICPELPQFLYFARWLTSQTASTNFCFRKPNPMRYRRLLSTLGLLWLLLVALAPQLLADEPKASAPADAKASKPDEPKFMRIKRDEAGEPVALQTAVVHYVPREDKQSGATVDLIGAVHVGEKDYYEALNKLFETYDVVLYELVAPEGTRVPKGGRTSGHPVALLQNGMKDMLGLEHQMQHVDYTKENLVHADMSPDDFAKSMEDKGESWGTMFFRMMGAGIAQQSRLQAQGKSSEFDFLAAFLSNDRAGAMKRMLAEQFEDTESMMQALEGP